MIKQLKVKNFQNNINTTYDFHPGINIITGISQAGKSAGTIKPIQLVKTNRPQGGRFLSNACGDEGDVDIELTLTGGSTGGGVDTVSLHKHIKKDKGGVKRVESTKYTVRGREYTDISDEVVEVLNLSEINIRGQHDPYFLVTSTPGEIAKTINRITHLDKADEWISDLTKQVNESTREVKRLQGEVSNGEVKLKKYADIDKTEMLVIKMEEVEGEVEDAKEELSEVKRLSLSIELIDTDIRLLTDVLEWEKFLIEAEVINKEVKDREKETELISDYLDVVYDVSVLEEVEGELFSIIGEIDKADIDYNNLVKERTLICDYLAADNLVFDLEKGKAEVEERLSKLLIKMGKCPTCFGKIDTKIVKRILEEL